jgi:Fe2+ transport system protein FeoA
VLKGSLVNARPNTLHRSGQARAARPVRLSDLKAGHVARLHAAELTPQDCALLKALGLTDRCVMRICKVGEPCIVQVQATRIGLSRTVANGIFVVPESHG